MAFSVKNYFYKLTTGVDIEEEQRKADAANEKLLQLNREKAESGKWTQEQADAANARIANDSSHNYEEQVDEAFNIGLQEGVNNLTGGAKKAMRALAASACS